MRSWRTAVPRLLTILPISILAAACSGGSGEGLGPPPAPPTSGATFSAIQQSVFTPTCATVGCHQGAGAPQGLRLDASSSHALLVGVPSSEVPALMRVDPGNPDDSYLVRKLEGTAAVGGRMPLGGAPLPQATIDDVRQWIVDGAIDDRVPSSDPIRVTSLSPVPGSDQPPPAGIVATFDREFDVSTVNANTFVVEGSGGDGTFDDGNEVPAGAAAITVPAMTPMSATFEVAAPGLADDTYRILLRGSGPSLILDLDANALDGEFGGSFPSGDGVAGGDFEATFTVTAPPVVPTFDEIQANVFTPTCATANCHAGPNPQQGMSLEAGASYANLVNVPSAEVPALLRVEPGNADDSYLIHKLEGTAAVGVQMPFDGPPLDPAVIDGIRRWIDDGAEQ